MNDEPKFTAQDLRDLFGESIPYATLAKLEDSANDPPLTNKQVRKSMAYFGISRSQLQRELVEQGATQEKDIIFPLQRWFATVPESLDPLNLKDQKTLAKYDTDGRDRKPAVE